jgi:hypothetical protein
MLLGIPAVIIVGLAIGFSGVMFITFEIRSWPKVEALMLGSFKRACMSSTILSFLVGMTMGPINGVIFEMVVFLPMAAKSYFVSNRLRRESLGGGEKQTTKPRQQAKVEEVLPLDVPVTTSKKSSIAIHF